MWRAFSAWRTLPPYCTSVSKCPVVLCEGRDQETNLAGYPTQPANLDSWHLGTLHTGLVRAERAQLRGPAQPQLSQMAGRVLRGAEAKRPFGRVLGQPANLGLGISSLFMRTVLGQSEHSWGTPRLGPRRRGVLCCVGPRMWGTLSIRPCG